MTSRQFILSNGLGIHADLVGEGPLMLCFSGFANSNFNFKPIASFLSSKRTLCMIDARGMGLSDPAAGEYSMDDLAVDGLEIARQLGFDEFDVCGISLGGYPAQLLAMKFPSQVNHLMLIATRGPGAKYQIIREITEEGFAAFMNMDPNKGNRLAIEAFVHPRFVKENPGKLEELVELRKRENKTTLEQSLMQLRAGFKFIRQEIDLSQIKAPTLIVAGAEDCFLPAQNAELLHQEIKNSKLVKISETSHLCFLEKPQEIAQHIIEFLISRKHQ